MAVAAVLAWRVPIEVIVGGILLAGTAHVLLEVRYVVGRFGQMLASPLFLVVNTGLVVIVLARLLRVPSATTIEVLVLAGLLVVTVVFATPQRPGWRAAGLLSVLSAAALALAHPGSWFVAQAHLHNLVPALFLWEWSGRIGDERVRRSFRLVTLLWAVVVPALVLSGGFDALVGGGAVVDAAGDAAAESRALGSVVPASLDPAGALGMRLLAAFAFAQVLHYYVWCVHFPRRAPDATARFEATPVGQGLRGWRWWALVVVLTLVVVGVALVEYRQGRTLYTSLAAYHAYLEYPVLVALVLAWGVRAAGVSAGPNPSPVSTPSVDDLQEVPVP